MQKGTDILKHITQTYLNLRVGIAILSFLLPAGMIIGVLLSKDVEMQGSISAFYHTPMRNLFVGLLVAVGSFLYLYKGFSVRENLALNIAGIMAIGVAFLPTAVPSTIKALNSPFLPPNPFTSPWLHGFCAVSLFIAIAYVCVKCGYATLVHIENEAKREEYQKRYKLIGISMIVLPILAVLFSYMFNRFYLVFIVEVVAILIFAYFWLLKSQELCQQANPLERTLMESLVNNKSGG